MTLEEAIIHCKEKACGNTQCALEHRQLAEWLQELQVMKSLPSNLDEAAEKCAEDTWLAGENWGDAARRTFKAGAELMAGQGWISVDERLPEMDQEVIVLTDEIGAAPIYKIGFGHIVDVERCIDYNG